jgi:hypothetical protein
MLFPSPRMERRVSWLRRVVFAVAFLGVSGSADAQVDYRLTAGLAGLATDNSGAQPAGGPTQADAAGVARGSIDLGYLGRFATDRLSYGIMATKWARNTQGAALTHTLRLSSDMEAAPATRVGLSAGATLSQLSLTDTVSAASLPTTGPQPTNPQPTSSQPSSPQQVGPQPGGDQTFFSLEARESISWQPSGQWRLDQGLTGSEYHLLGSGSGSIDNKGLTLDFGVAKLWQQDSAGLRGRLGVMKTSGFAAGIQPTTGAGYTELAESSLVWGHQWNAEVAQELSAGVLVTRSDQARAMPTASAALTWQRPGGMVSGRLAQTADYSVMVGSALQRRVATLAVGLPVNRVETMRLIGSADLERDSQVGAPAGSSGSINVFSAQAGLGWQPGDTFAYSLAYTFRDQWASVAGDTPSVFSSFRRQTVMFAVSAGYAGIF